MYIRTYATVCGVQSNQCSSEPLSSPASDVKALGVFVRQPPVSPAQSDCPTPHSIKLVPVHTTVLTRMYIRIYTLACNSYVYTYACRVCAYVIHTYVVQRNFMWMFSVCVPSSPWPALLLLPTENFRLTTHSCTTTLFRTIHVDSHRVSDLVIRCDDPLTSCSVHLELCSRHVVL